MSLHVRLFDEFGRFCANAENAASFRSTHIEPSLALGDTIVLDFDGVHNVNSSFANALVANLISQHSRDVMGKLHFANCNPIVRVAIEGAISLGLQRLQERGVAPA